MGALLGGGPRAQVDRLIIVDAGVLYALANQPIRPLSRGLVPARPFHFARPVWSSQTFYRM